jgi:integrase/recombinase XerD
VKYFLNQASAHSLRHTAGSHMTAMEVDLRLVCDNFGHASIATTCAYLPSSEEDARHEATQGAAPHRLDQQDLG